MRKKTLKGAALAALAGAFLAGGGCLGFGDTWWGRMAWDGLLDIGWDYVLDNDAVYDLTEDGTV